MGKWRCAGGLELWLTCSLAFCGVVLSFLLPHTYPVTPAALSPWYELGKVKVGCAQFAQAVGFALALGKSLCLGEFNTK